MAAITHRDGVRSFVLFTVGGMALALPLEGVLEILRPPALVPIPLGPPSLEGLARRRGAVLPVIGLRRVLGLAGTDRGESKGARLLIVRHNGQPVGLLVDRVSGLSGVGEDRIADVGTAPDASTGPSIDAELLAGAILAGEERDGALILDPGPMIERQFADLGRAGGAAGKADSGAAPQPKAATTAAVRDEEQLVVLAVGGQEFSLPVAAVREVVPVPDAVTRVPRARTHLLGVMTLRDALLPLVGLRELFGLDAAEEGGRGKVAVLRTAEGPVGVVVEGVREILRVPRGRIDPVPPLMAREAEFEDMDGIARLEGGARLIPVLSAERLFRHGAGHGASDAGDREGEAAVTTGAAAERADAFVVFRLSGAEYGLPVAAVREVLRQPDAVTPLPNAPDFVSGVTTLRGAVLPLVALRRLLRLPEGRGNSGERGRVVVIAEGTARAGLLVDGMAGIVRIPDGAIEPAPVVSQAQHRLIRRIGTLESAGERRMILLMDPAGLLDMDQLADLLAAV